MKKNKKIDIWKFINIRHKDECWLYNGSTFSGRYGRFFMDGKAFCAHRVVYELEKGDIGKGLFVMHICNNKLCCNPNHLTLVTNKDNQLHASQSNAFPLGVDGIRGVSYIKKRGYWRAQAYENGKCINLYTGPHKEKALTARRRWEEINYIKFDTKEK